MTNTKHILAVVIGLWLSSCEDSGNPLGVDTTLKHSILPVSDSAAIPSLTIATNVNTNEVSLLVSLPRTALFYEIDRATDTTASWQLVFVGDTLWYRIGVIPPTPPIFYRVRAVYSHVVSHWSSAVCVNMTPGTNLISNSTFEINGIPSLVGWTIPDSGFVLFSNDVPPGGSGASIILAIRHGVSYAWPSNHIYTLVIPPVGAHAYRLSFMARKQDMGGEVFVYRNRPSNQNTEPSMSQYVATGNWTLYSQTAMLSTNAGDTIFVTMTGGSGEYSGITYINTCRFELLN